MPMLARLPWRRHLVKRSDAATLARFTGRGSRASARLSTRSPGATEPSEQLRSDCVLAHLPGRCALWFSSLRYGLRYELGLHARQDAARSCECLDRVNLLRVRSPAHCPDRLQDSRRCGEERRTRPASQDRFGWRLASRQRPAKNAASRSIHLSGSAAPYRPYASVQLRGPSLSRPQSCWVALRATCPFRRVGWRCDMSLYGVRLAAHTHATAPLRQ